ncbi:hypothetical protein HDV06_002161 [Boothiomyces sp. JEL0866]|nr:hypothetical protein HDV06_002161 [Boothiomyces sp. JEL0866]
MSKSIRKLATKTQFNSEYQSKLVQGLKTYGFNPKTIKKEYHLEPDTFTIGKHLLFLNPARDSIFTAKHDIEILKKIKNKRPTWLELAYQLNKNFKQVHHRYENYLRPQVQQHNLPLEKAIDIAITNIENNIIIKNEWTPELDKKLLMWGRKLKCKFSLLVQDFNFSSQEIRQRYELLVDKEKIPFLPKHDKLIIDCTDFTKLHLEHLPEYSPARLRRRKQYLQKNLRLTEKDILELSRLVEQYGESFYKYTNIKDARVQWAVNEPKNQKNPVWTKEKDELLLSQDYRTMKGHTKLELETRHYYLLDLWITSQKENQSN